MTKLMISTTWVYVDSGG